MVFFYYFFEFEFLFDKGWIVDIKEYVVVINVLSDYGFCFIYCGFIRFVYVVWIWECVIIKVVLVYDSEVKFIRDYFVWLEEFICGWNILVKF